MPQPYTAQEELLLRTAPRLHRATRIELVSRSNPDDIRQVIDTRDRDYDPEKTGLLDGSVNVDVNRDTLRSLSVTLQDWTGDWFPGAGRSVWLDAMLKVSRGYVETQLWPQGVYELADQEVTDRRQVRLSAMDKASQANGRDMGGFINAMELSKGMPLHTAIAALAAVPTWGETLLNLTQTPDLLLPYLQQYGLTDYPWQKARDISNIPGNFRPLHYDERGYLTWAPDPDPTLLAPFWDIWPDGSRPGSARPDEFSFYIEASKQIDAHQLKNWVGVKGGLAKAAPVYATASDSDANSPLSTGRIGYRMHWWHGGRADPLITTEAEAQARADYELRRLKQWHERVPLRIMELPFIRPWDVVRVTNPDASLNDNYQIVGYTLPLAGSAEMTLQGWRQKKAVA